MPSSNGIEIDVSLWPVVRCTPRGRVADGDYEAMFARFEKLWAKGDRFFTITDTRFSDRGTALQRQLIGEWMKKNAATIKRHSLGSIVIVESALVRGALTAIGWVAQTDLQSSYVKDWAQASRLAIEGLERAGALNDSLRARLLNVR